MRNHRPGLGGNGRSRLAQIAMKMIKEMWWWAVGICAFALAVAMVAAFLGILVGVFKTAFVAGFSVWTLR